MRSVWEARENQHHAPFKIAAGWFYTFKAQSCGPFATYESAKDAFDARMKDRVAELTPPVAPEGASEPYRSKRIRKERDTL